MIIEPMTKEECEFAEWCEHKIYIALKVLVFVVLFLVLAFTIKGVWAILVWLWKI
jgi:hypothetical protein